MREDFTLYELFIPSGTKATLKSASSAACPSCAGSLTTHPPFTAEVSPPNARISRTFASSSLGDCGDCFFGILDIRHIRNERFQTHAYCNSQRHLGLPL